MNIADIAFALVLGLAAALAALAAERARPAARAYLRFASLLCVALSAGEVIASGLTVMAAAAFADAIALMVCALTPAVLALAVFAAFEQPPKPLIAASVLALCCLAGIAAAATDIASLSFACLFASVCAMLALAVRQARTDWRRASYVVIAGFCLLAGAASYMSGGAAGRTGLVLFVAAGLIGVSIALSRRSSPLVIRARDGAGSFVAIRGER